MNQLGIENTLYHPKQDLIYRGCQFGFNLNLTSSQDPPKQNHTKKA